MFILNIIGVILLIYFFNAIVFEGLCKAEDKEAFTKEDLKKAINKRRRKR